MGAGDVEPPCPTPWPLFGFSLVASLLEEPAMVVSVTIAGVEVEATMVVGVEVEVSMVVGVEVEVTMVMGVVIGPK